MNLLAYHKHELEAWRRQRLARNHHRQGLISSESLERILAEYPHGLYTTRPALKVLFFIGGLIAVGGAQGVFGIAFIDALNDLLWLMLLLMGMALIVFSEWVVINNLKHFRTGLPQSIYFYGFVFIVISFFLLFKDFTAFSLFLSALVALGIALRYLDRFALVTAWLMMSASVVMMFGELVGASKFVAPFVLSAVHLLLYFISRRLRRISAAHWWDDLFPVAETTSLLLAAAFMNLYVVQEGANEFLRLTGTVPLTLLFILTTIAFPVVYVVAGIVQRNHLLLRVGMVCMAGAAAALQYYYSTGHPEIVLTLAGSLILLLSIWLIRRLQPEMAGVTSLKTGQDNQDALDVLLAMKAAQLHEQAEQDLYGGGGFGGGGASGKY